MALICYAPFLVWLRDYSKRPWVAGLTFGLWYGLMNVTWLGQFVGRWTSSVFVGVFVVAFIGAAWGSLYGLGCWGLKAARTDSWKIVLLLSLPVMTWVRHNLPQLEFPFAPFGEPLVVYPYTAQVGKLLWPMGYGGSHLLEFWLLAVTILVVFAPDIVRRGRYFVSVLAGCVLLISLYPGKEPELPKTKIALGQLGFDMAYGDASMKPYQVGEAVTQLSAEARQKNAELLILPESVTQFIDNPVVPFPLTPDLPILFGAQHGFKPSYQAAYLWDGNGFQHTDKVSLVVFGEYVPFRGIIPYPKGFQLPSGDLAPGTERHLIKLPNGTSIGPMICFESLFTGASSSFSGMGADVLAIMSLDDWYVGTNAIPRLAIAARWRAIETRKWVFRVGSLGKTMIIDPKGRVRAELPVGPRRLLMLEEL